MPVEPTRAPDPCQGGVVLARAIEMLRAGHLSIDDDGRIWRHAIYNHHRWKSIERRRAENVSRNGYLRLTMGLPGCGETRSVMAHVLVWTWLNVPIPPGLQINHKDLDKKNNRPDNLELVDASGNIRHSYANGRPHPYSKSDPRTWRGGTGVVPEIRERIVRMRAEGATIAETSNATGVSMSHVQRIAGRRKEMPRISEDRKAEALRMHSKGFTQAEIADRTGISRTHLQRILGGVKS